MSILAAVHFVPGGMRCSLTRSLPPVIHAEIVIDTRVKSLTRWLPVEIILAVGYGTER